MSCFRWQTKFNELKTTSKHQKKLQSLIVKIFTFKTQSQKTKCKNSNNDYINIFKNKASNQTLWLQNNSKKQTKSTMQNLQQQNNNMIQGKLNFSFCKIVFDWIPLKFQPLTLKNWQKINKINNNKQNNR